MVTPPCKTGKKGRSAGSSKRTIPSTKKCRRRSKSCKKSTPHSNNSNDNSNSDDSDSEDSDDAAGGMPEPVSISASAKNEKNSKKCFWSYNFWTPIGCQNCVKPCNLTKILWLLNLKCLFIQLFIFWHFSATVGFELIDHYLIRRGTLCARNVTLLRF